MDPDEIPDEDLMLVEPAEFPEGDELNSTDFNPDGTAKEN